MQDDVRLIQYKFGGFSFVYKRKRKMFVYTGNEHAQ